MKKIFLFLALFVLSTSLVFATSFEAKNQIVKDTETDGDLYLVGNDITVNEDVLGDLFVAGNNVTINGAVYGDLLATGSQINVNGEVEDDARIIGVNVVINNNIGSDLVIPGAANITIADSTHIGGEALIVGGLFNFYGEIGENLRAFLLNLNFKGKVNGEADMLVDRQFAIDDNAFIGGDLKYFAIQKANFNEDVVKGVVKFNNTTGTAGIWEEVKSQFAASRLIFNLLNFIAILLVALLLIVISPKHLIKSASEIDNGFIKTFLIGLIAAISFFVFGFVLMITVVGIPLGLIFFAFTLVFLYVGKVFFAVWIAQKLIPLKANASRFKTFGVTALGLLFYYLIALVPLYVGFAGTLIFMFTGFGAFLTSRVTYFRFLQKGKMV